MEALGEWIGWLRNLLRPRKPAEPDFYLDDQGRTVFTASFLLKRGTCCGSGCRHCPYQKE